MLMQKIKHKLNIYRRYIPWKKAGCIYIHVPKAAGTSISKSIYGRPLGHYTTCEIFEKFPKLFASAYKFSFVRNPWDRVLSAYRFAKIGRTESMGIYKPEQYAIPEFDSFESFVFDWLLIRDINKLDFVFQPQYKFLYSENGTLMVDFLGKLERLNNDIKTVEQVLGTNLVIPFANRTSRENNYRDAYKNTSLIEKVREIYLKDITLFNYEF